jgi:hypothetical protein
MPLPQRGLSSGEAQCTLCAATNRPRIYPAALSAQSAARPESAQEGEAACYDHPGKRAVAACSQCGRFVCQLCEVKFGAEVWCPSCVAAGAGKARVANEATGRSLYDSTALILPLASLALWPFTIVTAPVALVLSILRWRQPLSLVRRNRWRFVAAMLISGVEIAGWCWLIFYIVSGAAGSKRAG